MEIKAINIYGYGKLENVYISNLNNVNVFFGENEVGKSTIMSFIHSILFGFPTRQQTSLLGYEPKFHSKYGGMLVLYFKKYGRVTVERVKGKATGDVTVTMEDGKIGDEDLLADLLANIDRQTFNSIYSFNIHDIQNVGKINKDDLNRFLFSSSVVGTDKLVQAEQELQLELANRFKKRGQKPTVNVILRDLIEENKKLSRAKQANESYMSLIKDREKLSEKAIQLKSVEDKLVYKISLIEKWDSVGPNFHEINRLERELHKIEEISFPHDGVNRLQQLEQLLLRLKTELAGKKERLQRVREQVEHTRPDEKIVKNESLISSVTEKMPLYEKLKHDKNGLTIQIANLAEEITLLKEQSDLKLNKEKLELFNSSITVKNDVSKIDQSFRQLLTSNLHINNRLDELNSKLKMLQDEQSRLKDGELSIEEVESLESKLKVANNLKEKEIELESLSNELSFLKLQKESIANRKRSERNSLYQTIMISFLLAIIAVVSFFYGEKLIATIALTGVGLLLLLKLRHDNQAENDFSIDEKIAETTKKYDQLNEQIKGRSQIDVAFIEQQLFKNDELCERLRYIGLEIKQVEENILLQSDSLKEVEQEISQLRQKSNQYGEKWGLPQENLTENLLTIFNSLQQLKSLYRKDDQLKSELEIINNKINSIEAEVKSLIQKCNLNELSSINENVLQLKQERQAELEKNTVYNEKNRLLNELNDELGQLNVEKLQISEEINKLLASANVKEIEQFYKVSEKYNYRRQLLQQLNELKRLVNNKIVNEMEVIFGEIPIELTNEKNNASLKLREIKAEQEEINDELARLNYEIEKLEEGGTYTERLHRFKLKQEQLHDATLDWAKYALAQDILRQTMNKYREEKLPQLLVKANKYLQELTDDNYRAILLSDSGQFIVERKDYAKFEPHQLSQATAEQVYVALRFALATTLSEQSIRLPLIIDDSFVNFDKNRVEKAIALLSELSKSHQILFFTCHDHIKDYFSNEEIIDLHKQLQ